MKNYTAFALLVLTACGGTAATSAGANDPSTHAAAVSELGTIPLDTWFVVQSASERGLPVGSGLRFRVEAFDVTSHGLAQSMASTCTAVSGGLDCDGSAGLLEARARADGSVSAHQGPHELVLVRASEADSATWSAAVIANDEQRAACSAAADCCVAMENQRGNVCDLNARLGGRTTESCRAALDALRSELAVLGGEAPTECR